MTANSLRKFLTTTHATIHGVGNMPNPQLADYQLNEVIAYILSLRHLWLRLPKSCMKQRQLKKLALTTPGLLAVAVLLSAQMPDIGRREYVNSCAVCHGEGGRGDGPVSAYLRVAPVDLTTLQKNNGGVFPFGRVYEIIDGRNAIAAHGPRDMPVWGDRFKEYNAEQSELALRFKTPVNPEAFARDRILALIRHISSFQVK